MLQLIGHGHPGSIRDGHHCTQTARIHSTEPTRSDGIAALHQQPTLCQHVGEGIGWGAGSEAVDLDALPPETLRFTPDVWSPRGGSRANATMVGIQ